MKINSLHKIYNLFLLEMHGKGFLLFRNNSDSYLVRIKSRLINFKIIVSVDLNKLSEKSYCKLTVTLVKSINTNLNNNFK